MLTSGNVKGFYPIISYKIKSSFMSFLDHNDNSTTIIRKKFCGVAFCILSWFISAFMFCEFPISQHCSKFNNLFNIWLISNQPRIMHQNTVVHFEHFAQKSFGWTKNNCFIFSWGQIPCCAHSHSHSYHSVLQLIKFIFIVSDSFRTNN